MATALMLKWTRFKVNLYGCPWMMPRLNDLNISGTSSEACNTFPDKYFLNLMIFTTWISPEGCEKRNLLANLQGKSRGKGGVKVVLESALTRFNTREIKLRCICVPLTRVIWGTGVCTNYHHVTQRPPHARLKVG